MNPRSGTAAAAGFSGPGPRILVAPASASTERATVAIELAASAGLILDPWQQLGLRATMGTTGAGRWVTLENGICVARQNGKDGILEARELYELFEGIRYGRDPLLVVHSAHMFDTSLEHFRRLLWLIENSDELRPQVKRVSRSHGEEGIELLSGNRIRFRTRTKGGGRGFSGDLVLLNEAMDLQESAVAALFPLMSARPNPQLYYTGSAVDQETQEHGVVFARVRGRALAGGHESLAYLEWSLPYETPDKVPDAVLADPASWAETNPAFGIRITEAHIAAELRSGMSRRSFCVERLGVGDWPDVDLVDAKVLALEEWNRRVDLGSVLLDPVVLGFDVSPDRQRATIGAAGRRSDGLGHLEVVDDRPGTAWIPERLVGLCDRHDVSEIVCDGVSAASIVPEIEQRGLKVRMLTAQEYAQACGRLVDSVKEGGLRHLGQKPLEDAVDGAETRPLGDAWAWSRRRSSTAYICPLVAVTVALFSVETEGPSVYEERDVVVV